MAKEIPGFYFDEEKQKYFKIQPNHVAPKGSRYSKDAISIENEARLVGVFVLCLSSNIRSVVLNNIRSSKMRNATNNHSCSYLNEYIT